MIRIISFSLALISFISCIAYTTLASDHIPGGIASSDHDHISWDPSSANNPCISHKPRVFHPFMYDQCILDHRDDVKCGTNNQYGMINITCDDVLHVHMSMNYSTSVLLDALGDKDDPKHKHPIMTVKIIISDIIIPIVNDSSIERDLDEFLTPRPWWKLVHDSSGHSLEHNVFVVVLERYPVIWRGYLDFLVATQYPSAEVCEQSALLAGRQPGHHPGMMPILTVFGDAKAQYPYAVFIYYWPTWNAFVSESDCPGILNKWDCAFMKMSNCSIPTFIQNCTTHECLSGESIGAMWVIGSDKASADGSMIKNLNTDPVRSGKFMKPIHKEVLVHVDEHRRPPDLKFVLPHDRSLWRVDNPSASFALFNYLFMTRPNAFYRPKMKQLIHEMRVHSKPHFHPHSPCVAVHIRRGDRIRPGINMLEYCANTTYDNDPSHTTKKGCVNIDNASQFGNCPKLSTLQDLGCKTIPFEAVRLKHIISKVPRLLNHTIHDLLVFSDDPIFVAEQAQELQLTDPQWRIHTLKSPELPASIDMEKFHHDPKEYDKVMQVVRDSAGTESGVFFHTSFKTAQQCSGLIAHFGSGVASLFYHAMCIEHSGRYGTCPPAYDMRWGL